MHPDVDIPKEKDPEPEKESEPEKDPEPEKESNPEKESLPVTETTPTDKIPKEPAELFATNGRNKEELEEMIKSLKRVFFDFRIPN